MYEYFSIFADNKDEVIEFIMKELSDETITSKLTKCCEEDEQYFSYLGIRFYYKYENEAIRFIHDYFEHGYIILQLKPENIFEFEIKKGVQYQSER